MIIKEADSYRNQLRTLALDYYHGRISYVQFRLSMIAAINNGITTAWLSGREFLGITAETGLNVAERMRLYREISRELRFVNGLSNAIDKLSSGGKDVSLISRRLELWGDAYARTEELSKIFHGGDIELEWVLHPAEHCRDCLSLEGQIKKASEWLKLGVHPKSWRLSCRQGCKCELRKVSQ